MIINVNKFRNIYCIISNIKSLRFIHVSTNLGLDQKWRKNQRLGMNPNTDGPLTNLPDYSFIDGRPVPLGARQKLRLGNQKELAGKIVTMLGELNFAKTRYKLIQDTNQNQVINSKLKPKGHLLFKK